MNNQAPAKVIVGVRVVRKVNMGNYETADIEVSVSQETNVVEGSATYDQLYAWANEKADAGENDLRSRSGNQSTPQRVAQPAANITPAPTPATPAAPVQVASANPVPGMATDTPPAPAEDTPPATKAKKKAAKKAAKKVAPAIQAEAVGADGGFTRAQMTAVLTELARHPQSSQELAVALLQRVSGEAQADVKTVADTAIHSVAVHALKALIEAHIGYTMTQEAIQEIVKAENVEGVAWADLVDGVKLVAILNNIKNSANNPAPTAEVAPVAPVDTARKDMIAAATTLYGKDQGRLGELLVQVGGVTSGNINDTPDNMVAALTQAINIDIARIDAEGVAPTPGGLS